MNSSSLGVKWSLKVYVGRWCLNHKTYQCVMCNGRLKWTFPIKKTPECSHGPQDEGAALYLAAKKLLEEESDNFT